ncbi:group III truncated hemoglobin [Pontibacter actiniarum]|uniref:Sec-independent protein translocase TatC n=1 Tax=Pontibacter actiniarum TaxID=323450 RepID=A0A1X9YUS0_9BACT|nr:group III truncated hemoglobin [Pontibacter actiniarum]ARS36608.1 sec-independent protein translocase TatC [Pontibacter actiniarum]
MKRDLATEEDIKLLVDTFYDHVNQDDLLSPVFNGFAKVDWSRHLPVMYNFWSSVLFGSIAYKGQPFPKHMRLPIERKHFSRWVSLFLQTVDELFEGTKAEEAKHKASSIARVFQMKMGLFSFLDQEADVV